MNTGTTAKLYFTDGKNGDTEGLRLCPESQGSELEGGISVTVGAADSSGDEC